MDEYARPCTLTPKSKLALALARLDRAWENVPPAIQLRLIAAIAAVAEDYDTTGQQRHRVPLVGRITR